MLTLNSLAIGAGGRIAGFDRSLAETAVQRLREMGLDEGVAVTLVRRLPLGGPVILSMGAMDIALRPDEAGLIRITG